MNKWTEAETAVLLENYNKVSNSELQKLLPTKSPLGIYKKAYALGLRKSPEIEFLNRSEVRKGSKGSNWKGGVKTTRAGYRVVLMPEHHRADAGGYVMEHILVWEQATGIPVSRNCCIHHLNGDKSDNRIENLCMMLHSAHTAFHHIGLKRSDETRQKISERKKKAYE